MMRQLRKIVIVNTADEGGGAERVSMAVLKGFLELGLDAWLLVGNKSGDHFRVLSFSESPFFDYRPYGNAHLVQEIERRRNNDLSIGLEDFNHPYSHRISEMTGSPPDLVLCHNLHGGYFDLRVLSELSGRVPVALRLFDTWLQAGHCGYSLGCDRWRNGCGACPDLTIPPAISQDASRFNLQRKQRIFQEARLFISAESRWMLDRAKQSVLAAAAIDWKHIPGGVDLDTFFPGSRNDARERLGLDPDTKLLLYVANQGSANRYKDFDTVRRALAALPRRHQERGIVLLVAGSNAQDEEVVPGIQIRHVGYIQSRPHLADFYRAADIAIHSAFEETFGNVVAEALACGTPVVAASGGGVLELIDHGRTGLAVPPREPARLADAIAQLLDMPAFGAEMGAAAAEAARRNLDSQVMIRNLQSWCSEAHSAWHAHEDTGLRKHFATRLAEMEAKDAVIGELRSELAAQSEAAATRLAEMEAKDAVIGELRSELAAQSEAAATRLAEMAAKDAVMGELRSELAVQSEAAATRLAEMEAKDAVIGELRSELAIQSEAAATRLAEMEAKDAVTGELRSELAVQAQAAAERLVVMNKLSATLEQMQKK
jgi:glycosyltransferase involved in cell wall biosynthesis